jgi:uncharacterized OB-fold protein
VPARDGLDAPFWEGTQRHELVLQRCADCRRFRHPAEWICFVCRSFHFTWEPVAARGRIYSWERVWHPVHPALKERVPYLVVLVELPEADNARIVGNLLGDPMQEVCIGAEVEAVFEDHADGYTLVQWQVKGATTDPHR